MRPAAASAALAGAPWDSEPLVVLSRAHIGGVLKRLLAEEWPASDVEQWADLVEGRDDIELEPGHEELLKEVLFDMANPAIQGPLDHRVAHELLTRLAAPEGKGW
jgi:hypothetical protein